MSSSSSAETGRRRITPRAPGSASRNSSIDRRASSIAAVGSPSWNAIAAAEAALPDGLALAGASYHGIGIPACVRSATNAADRVHRHVAALPE